MVPWKGLDTLIKLMPEFWQVDEEIKLKIIGTGPEKEKLEKEIKKLKTHKQGHIKLLGQISNSQALGFMKAADIFVLNSGYEGLPHVVLECFALGVPVIASRSGGNSELVIPGKSGDLFDYNDSRIIKNKILNFFETADGKNLWLKSEEGEEFLRQFEFNQMVKNLRNEIEKLCEF